MLLNIGTYHLLGCNDLNNYIKAKAEILDGLNNRGTLILNADDKNIAKINYSRYKGNIIKIGLSQSCDYRASDIHYTENGMKFLLYYQNNYFPVYVKGFGKHNVYNSLAAIATAHAVNIEINDAIKALGTFRPIRQHLQFREGINGSVIIDDTWNCTPPSIKAALEVLRDVANGRKKIAVIGYMPQLGENGKGEYLKVGEWLVKAEVDLLVTIGEEVKIVGVKAVELGMDQNQVFNCNTGTEIFDILQAVLDKNTITLFKFPYKYRLRKITSFRQLIQNVFAKG